MPPMRCAVRSTLLCLLLVLPGCDEERQNPVGDVISDAASDLMADGDEPDTALTDSSSLDARDSGGSDTADVSTDTVKPDTSPADLAEVDGGGFPPLPVPTQEGLIIGVDETFWHNLDDLVFNVAAQRDVKLYLTVFDANFYGRAEHRALGMELVRHPESLLQNALVPLLERYGDSGVIWAIDCLNEPEAMIAGNTGNWSSWGVSWDEMRAYLSACADVVHGHSNLKVSAGSGWHDWANVQQGRYAGLGFDFYDFHAYDDTPAFPSAAAVGGSVPVVISECGQASDAVDDALQLSAVGACFDQAVAGGYLAALSWYYDFAGSQNEPAHLEADGGWRPVRSAFEAHAGAATLIGINLAWFGGAYDHDLGLNPLHPSWGTRYDHAEAAAVFDDLDGLGVPLLRMWLFEGQEALPFHAVFEDFESPSPWAASGSNVALRASTQHATDGSQSVAVHLTASQPGWYGLGRTWGDEALLNLAPGTEWRFSAHNALGVPVGVNLAMVADGQVYQTRSGAAGGQLWLEDGASGSRSVTLGAADFADQWALDSAPDVGVARPADAALQRVSELRVRVYLSATQVPVDGDLFLDAVRVR